MLGSSTRGLRFMSTFLAVSVIYQVVALAAAESKSGHSFRMSGWKKHSYIWCTIGGVSLCCFDAVTDGTAARRDPCAKSVCCGSR